MPILRPGHAVGAIRIMGVLLALLAPARAAADELYFVMVFGSQRVPNEPKYAHTFATFVKATGTGTCFATYSLEAHTISWLPRNMNVRVNALLPECGHNFDLYTTLRQEYAQGDRVSMWGPHQTTPDLYYRALKQIRLLESGRVKYKAVDTGYRTDRVSNCIHAVASITEGYRLRITSPYWGQVAAHHVEREFKPWFLGPGQPHTWVSSRLGLDAYPIIYRDFGENPRSGGMQGYLRAVLRRPEPQPTYGPPR